MIKAAFGLVMMRRRFRLNMPLLCCSHLLSTVEDLEVAIPSELVLIWVKVFGMI
jgi:hypothetical protein